MTTRIIADSVNSRSHDALKIFFPAHVGIRGKQISCKHVIMAKRKPHTVRTSRKRKTRLYRSKNSVSVRNTINLAHPGGHGSSQTRIMSQPVIIEPTRPFTYVPEEYRYGKPGVPTRPEQVVERPAGTPVNQEDSMLSPRLPGKSRSRSVGPPRTPVNKGMIWADPPVLASVLDETKARKMTIPERIKDLEGRGFKLSSKDKKSHPALTAAEEEHNMRRQQAIKKSPYT